MRAAFPSRINLVPVTLFALAFASVLFFNKLAGVDPQGSGEVASPAVVSPDVVPAATSVMPRYLSRPRSINAAPDTNIAGEAVPGEAMPQVRRHGPQAASTSQLNPLPSSTDDDSPHASAIPNLNASSNLDADAASLTILAATIRDDNNTANRLRAMSALSTLADQGIQVPYIRDVLRLAAADADSDVADHAKDAYDHLIQRDDSLTR